MSPRRRQLDAEFVELYAELRAQKRLGLVARFVQAFARRDRIWVEELPGLPGVWILGDPAGSAETGQDMG